MNMVWLAILATMAGLGPQSPDPGRMDRGPATIAIVRGSDHRSSSTPLDLSVIDDRDVEADFDDPWLLPAASLAADPFEWLAWSIPGVSVDRPSLDFPESRPSCPFPLRC